MIKKLPLRLRLTLTTISLLTVCCVGLTFILNLSADKMATSIEATTILPAKVIGQESEFPNTSSENTTLPIPLENPRQSFRMESIFYMLIIIVGGGALTYYISGKSLKPLNNLSSQIKNISVHNLSEEIDIPDIKDEIADLTLSFNEMTRKLNDAFLMHERFSANAAHELRTPLAVLQTKVDVFKKKKTHTPEEYDSLIRVFEIHTNRLSDLVKNLLDMTTIGEIELNQSISLKNILDDVTSELSNIAKEKNVIIHLSKEDKKVFGNYDLLYHAFYNIIENGIKYNVDGGNIDVCIKSHDDKTIIKISDTGIGIPDEMKETVFEPFFRVDKSRSRQMGGAGLGLSIVKAIIEKHKGTINVKDIQKGGSCFEITLNIK